MHTATFSRVQPILDTRDVAKAVRFYVDWLGFTLAFGVPTNEGNYVGLRRDRVELHMGCPTSRIANGQKGKHDRPFSGAVADRRDPERIGR